MQHKGHITISRPNCSSGKKYITISIVDKKANIEFAEIELSLSNFTEALTGMGHTDCLFTVRGLANVGKVIQRKVIQYELPDCDYSNRKEIATKIGKNLMDDDWELDVYFGSQDSFFAKDGKQYANTSMFRWVDKDTSNE